MAYDERAAERIRELVVDDLDVTEKRMFGGLAFLVNGNMSVTVIGRGGLMVRLDPADAELMLDAGPMLDGQRMLDSAAIRPFEMRGKPMKGWLRVEEAGFETDAQLRDWVERSLEFARTLPPHD